MREFKKEKKKKNMSTVEGNFNSTNRDDVAKIPLIRKVIVLALETKI